MPVDPCLPVPLGGYAPPHPPVHRSHRIIGRIRHHGRAHHGGAKTGMAPLDGCGRVPAGLPGALPGKGAAPAAFLPKIIPAAAGGAAVVGGSGFIGGGGGGGGTVPVGGGNNPGGSGGGGTPGCTGANCNPTQVPEPASFLLLGMALLLVAVFRPSRRLAARAI
jgi:hypothetical protein